MQNRQKHTKNTTEIKARGSEQDCTPHKDRQPNTGLVPGLARGEDRRATPRNQQDWRVGPRTLEFLGVNFDPLTPIQTLNRAKWMTTEHAFRYIVTPNVDHVVRFTKNPEVFKPLYAAAWLCVCDSRILEMLSGFSDVPLTAVPGSDLTTQLFDNIITPDDPVTVIGADTDIINTIKDKYGLSKIHHYQPPMGLRNKPDEVAKTAKFIADHPSRYVFICVGSPQQEMIAKACLNRGDCVGLGLCVGASLEFISGRVKRAPKWMQRTRLEWLFRLVSEPRRLWKRYLVEGPKIFWIWFKWTLR